MTSQALRTTVTITKSNRPRIDLLAVAILLEKGLQTVPSTQDTLLIAIEEALLKRGYPVSVQKEPSAEIRRLLELDRFPPEAEAAA